MNGRNATQMTPQEILAEVSDHKQSMERSAARLRELSKVLHDRMRQNTTDEESGVYLAVSNVWTRFAGIVTQGLTRTNSADRMLRMLPSPEEKAEAERVSEKRKARHAKRQKQKAAETAVRQSPVEALMEMYSSEDAGNAGR